MGSIKIPTLSINSIYLYYKNIFNSNFSFWYYYYFFFFFYNIINYIIIDNILLNFYKKKYIMINLKINSFIKKKNFLGTFHLFKFQKWFILNLFLCKQLSHINLIKLNSFINIKKLFFKIKLNYKYLINK